MNDAFKASKELKAFLGTLSHVQAALEILGKAERSDRETEAHLARLANEVDDVSEKLVNVKIELKEAEERRDRAETDSRQIIDAAAAKAQDDALEMHKVTKAEAEKILSEARDRRKVVDADTEFAKKALQDIRAKTGEARVELQTVRAELAKIKERIGA